MPVEYLREIAHLQLPLKVEEEAKIDTLRVLQAADLVSVVLPIATENVNFATVLAITQKGQEVLAFNLERIP